MFEAIIWSVVVLVVWVSLRGEAKGFEAKVGPVKEMCRDIKTCQVDTKDHRG
jgi:hypothetical protein